MEPWWPVRIASCVSASIPEVTRTSTRRTPAAAARSISSSESRTTRPAPASAAARSSSSPLLLPCTISRSPGIPARTRERQLTERRDVGAEPFLAEQAQQREVGERLGAVGDERVRRRAAVGARLRAQGRLAVDEQRRAVLGGELAGRGRRRARARRPRPPRSREAGRASLEGTVPPVRASFVLSLPERLAPLARRPGVAGADPRVGAVPAAALRAPLAPLRGDCEEPAAHLDRARRRRRGRASSVEPAGPAPKELAQSARARATWSSSARSPRSASRRSGCSPPRATSPTARASTSRR